MPALSVWALRLALSWFVVGATLGAWMLAAKGLPGVNPGYGFLPTHMTAMLFGWLVQAIFAVAYWMLPRFGRERPRVGAAIAAVVCINAAAAVALAAPWFSVERVVAALELVAVAAFAVHAWPRVKAFGR